MTSLQSSHMTPERRVRCKECGGTGRSGREGSDGKGTVKGTLKERDTVEWQGKVEVFLDLVLSLGGVGRGGGAAGLSFLSVMGVRLVGLHVLTCPRIQRTRV
ncbi:hypothetical protein E2C01_021300 [Portunus trituberculatus]|uniref:Uncharacterized protein n=1 Tax=Portunus trituberculatus TaxID=210409 RepID=A0A5B7E408_PORTR|nr:hypothetical protein [Portunus trituberculatus]